MSTPEIPTIAESELAEKIGLDREALREKRITGLENPRHWLLVKSAIHYTGEGVRAVCACLDIEVPEGWEENDDPEKMPEKKGAADEAAVPVFVTRRAGRNPHIVFAQDGSREIAVRVRSASLVGIGDELRVKITGNLGTLYGAQPRPLRRRAVPQPRPARS